MYERHMKEICGKFENEENEVSSSVKERREVCIMIAYLRLLLWWIIWNIIKPRLIRATSRNDTSDTGYWNWL